MRLPRPSGGLARSRPNPRRRTRPCLPRRLRSYRSAAAYGALALATLVFLFYRGPLQPPPAELVHSRMVLEESFAGYQSGSSSGSGGSSMRTGWRRSWAHSGGGSSRAADPAGVWAGYPAGRRGGSGSQPRLSNSQLSVAQDAAAKPAS